MNSTYNDLVKAYYSNTFNKYGATCKGVDWSTEDSQLLRFKQLSKLFDEKKGISLADFGCGFGSFYKFMSVSDYEFEYLGLDLVHEMIDHATKVYGSKNNCSFRVRDSLNSRVDYVISSGIFNVVQNIDQKGWINNILTLLHHFDEFSNKGFVFNCLTSYSDKDKMDDNLYYADPCQLFDYCKTHFSRNVSLLHDYGLYEFTILVRKI